VSGSVTYNFSTAFNRNFNSQASVMQKKEKGRTPTLHRLSSNVENLPLTYPGFLFFLSVLQ
jgi:hypothetical protein